MFLRPKKDGCFRPAMNLENISQFIPYSHIKMDSLKQVKHLLHQKGLMVKLNLQDTYFSVSHPPETQKYLRFQWEVNLYQFLYLCFCLGLAPRIFTNLSRQHSNNRQEPGGNLNESRHCNSQDTHNHVHDIFGFFGGSANFLNHKWNQALLLLINWYLRDASPVAKRLKTKDVRKLGNIRKISKLHRNVA